VLNWLPNVCITLLYVNHDQGLITVIWVKLYSVLEVLSVLRRGDSDGG
jgi:hypothetical protein